VNEYDASISWCPSYADSYLRVIYPFTEKVIISQMFAHYHLDEFRVLLSPQKNSPNSVISSIMLHPSISPQHDNNPSFRHYHYYRETGTIADYAHFYLDLALITLTPSPRWNLEYTFQSAYSVGAVNTEAFARIWHQISDGFSSYFARYSSFKNALYIPNALATLCSLSTMTEDAFHKCLSASGDEK